MPDPAWPAVTMAVIQAADALFCAIPLGFVTKCLDDVGLAPRYRWLLPPIKAAAAVGLIAGLWIPVLAAVTAACLVAYFTLAVAAHIGANDFGQNMINAFVLLVFSGIVLVTSV